MANTILENDILVIKISADGSHVYFYPITKDENIIVNETSTLDEKLSEVDASIDSLKKIATQSTDGLMSASDKSKLDEIDNIKESIEKLDVNFIETKSVATIETNGFSVPIPDSIKNSKASHYIGSVMIVWSSTGRCSELTFSIPKNNNNEFFHPIYVDKSSGSIFTQGYVYHLSISISEDALVFKLYNNQNSLISDFSSLCSNAPEVDFYDIGMSKM